MIDELQVRDVFRAVSSVLFGVFFISADDAGHKYKQMFSSTVKGVGFGTILEDIQQ